MLHQPTGMNRSTTYFGDVFDNPAQWAKKCVEEYGADVIAVRLKGADPDVADASPEDCVKVIKDILAAVSCPLIVLGSARRKDNQVLPAVAEASRRKPPYWFCRAGEL